MTLSLSELLLLREALSMAAARHDSYARYVKGTAKKHYDKAIAMRQLGDRLSTFRARRDLVEVMAVRP